jgi:hydrogenase expression/formation protein HypD
MNYLAGFRDSRAAAAIRERVAALGERLQRRGARPYIMEVCGTHTMAIARYGIRELLPPGVELVSGPGCPVCVTDAGYLDAAIRLAEDGAIVATFGDLLHVPGSRESLAHCRARGGDVRALYSPSGALELAAANPGRQVVFLGIGFETTIAPVVSVVATARRQAVANFSVLTAFKLVPPALRALRADPEMRIDAFLCPAHVSAIIGADAYREFAGSGGVPCVVAGFEPLDILMGLEGILAQVAAGEARVENQYSRVVKPGGNPRALALFRECLEPEDAAWRGVGVIPGSGMALRREWAEFDAAKRFSLSVVGGTAPAGCLCGEIIKGKRQPSACPMFGRACTPDRPIGPCMVSAEGTCAAWFKYRRLAASPAEGKP